MIICYFFFIFVIIRKKKSLYISHSYSFLIIFFFISYSFLFFYLQNNIIRMSNLIYTNILHNPRKILWLSVIEYVVCDMVYHLSNNPKHNWCIMTRENMWKEVWLSKQWLMKVIERLILCWLIEKDENTKFIKTTQKRYDGPNRGLPPRWEDDRSKRQQASLHWVISIHLSYIVTQSLFYTV